MSKIAAFIIATILAVPAFAADIKELTPLEREEQIQNMKKLNNLVDEASVLLNKIALETEGQCMMSVGETVFCKCISMKLPTAINFIQYVGIVGATKEELKYDQLSADDKKLVDSARLARDECVK